MNKRFARLEHLESVTARRGQEYIDDFLKAGQLNAGEGRVYITQEAEDLIRKKWSERDAKAGLSAVHRITGGRCIPCEQKANAEAFEAKRKSDHAAAFPNPLTTPN
jgi:hypothetical protein